MSEVYGSLNIKKNLIVDGTISSSITTGIAPLSVTSTTLNTNLNADLLDGQQGSYYNDPANLSSSVSITKGGTGLSSLGTANQVIGMNAGASAYEYKTLTAGTGVSITHGTNSITISNSGGTVTTVGLALPNIFDVTNSPVTSSGTLTATLTSQNTNLVLASPNGSSGTPSFRSLAVADIPTLTASKISDFDTQVRTSRLDQMSVPTSSVSMNSQKITGLADPDNDTDAANKSYVDAIKQGLDIKDSVRVATVGSNITLSGGAPDALDGISLALNNRILVKDQTAAEENGIYYVSTLGTGSNGTWTRTTDANTSGKVTTGMYAFVSEGTTNADSGWTLITNDTITLGTTPLTFSQFSGAGQITAGDGLTKSGNTLNVVTASSSRIVVNADSVDLATTTVSANSYGSATQVGTFTVDAYGRLTTAGNTTITPAWSSITSKPTTLSGFGITDALSNSSTSTQNGYFGDVFVQGGATSFYTQIHSSSTLTANRTLTITTGDTNRTVTLSGDTTLSGTNTGDQTITLTGDVTGSGTGSFTTTLANSGVTANTYNNSATAITPITVDAKGRITATGASVTITPAWSSITSTPTTLSGFGITDAVNSVTSQTANTVLASPNGSSGSPSFRSLVAADIPTLTASKISDFDTQVRTSRLDQMAAPTTSVSMNSQKITSVADPTNAQDAATKTYADSIAIAMAIVFS